MITIPDPGVVADLGEARFSTYLRACRGDETRAKRLYMWNLSLAARWWGPICYFEVALRNAMHNTLIDVFGQKEWWDSGTCHLAWHAQRNLDDARRYAAGRKGNGGPAADDVVAASSMGLWKSLLHADNAQHIWRDGLDGLFRHPGAPMKRGPIYNAVSEVKRLRDRIAHHEPIFDYDQQRLFGHILMVSGAIDPDLEDIFHDCFPGLLAVIDGRERSMSTGEFDL